MILYRLRCNDDHEFEGWFRNAAAFDQQRDSGTLECPVCGTGAVSKALMAPSIAKGREPATAIQAPAPEVQAAAEANGRAAGGERGCRYGLISGVDGSLKKKKTIR